jgi:uncharacterized protein
MAKKTRLKPERVYVDTSAFISFLDGSDTFHQIFARLFADPPRLITTTLVIAEGHGWFLKRFDSQRALQFLCFIEKLSTLEIMAVDTKEITLATKIIRKFSDQSLTMTDAVGLSLMTQLKIKRCWSTDRHMSLSGAELVIY